MTVGVQTAEASAQPRGRLLIALLAGALAAGVAAALTGPVIFLAVAFAAAVFGILLYPREAAIPVALAAPVANLAVLRVPDVIDVRFHQILWLTLLFALLLRALVGRSLRLGRPPRWLTLSLLGIAGWQLLSALVNGGGARSIVKVGQIGYFSIVLWLLAASFAALPRERRDRVLRWTAVGAGGLVLAWMVYYLSGAQLPLAVTATVGGGVEFAPPGLKVQAAGLSGMLLTRMGMFGLAAVSAASVLAAVPGVTLAVGLTSADARRRFLGWTLFVISSSALLLTFSRAGWVIGLGVVLLVAWRIGRGSTLWIGLALAAVVIVLLAVPQVAARVQDFSNPEEGSLLSHVKLYDNAIGMANDQPLLGAGPFSFADRNRDPVSGDPTPVHNFVLEAAAETGWVGAAFTVAFVVALLVWGWRRLGHAPPVAFACWCGLLASVLMALTMNGFREDTLWVWAGLMVGAAITRPEPAPSRPAPLPWRAERVQ